MWIALLVLTGFLIGGTWSFVRNRAWTPAAVVGVAALMAGAATILWLPK